MFIEYFFFFFLFSFYEGEGREKIDSSDREKKASETGE